MCLGRIDRKKTEMYQNKTDVFVAYKVVKKSSFSSGFGSIYVPSCLFSIGENEDKVTDFYRTLSDAYLSTAKDEEETTYLVGFHSFLDKNEAIRYFNYQRHDSKDNFRLIEISIHPKDVICVGFDNYKSVIVSKKIHIKSFRNLKKEYAFLRIIKNFINKYKKEVYDVFRL